MRSVRLLMAGRDLNSLPSNPGPSLSWLAAGSARFSYPCAAWRSA